MKQRLLPFAFILVALALYWPTRTAGFVTDWLGWQYAYDRGGWAGVPTSFGYRALHPVLHFFNYLLYLLFGANGPGQYVVYTALHGLNAWLLYRLARRLPLEVSPEQSGFIALTAGGLFLLSPYAAEVVVWRACLHYLLAMFFSLLALHRAMDWLETGARRAWWQTHLLYLVALLSFEWSLITPLLLGVLAVAHHVTQERSAGALAPRLGRLFWPQAVFLAVYLLVDKLRFDEWVAHYGENIHLNFNPHTMVATMLKYVVKQFGFARHWEHAAKTRVFDGLDAGWPFWLGLGLVVAGAAGWLLFFRRSSARVKWAGVSFVWFFVALLPVSNLFFCYLLLSENDRYGYFAAAFGWLGLALILSFLPKIPARMAALGLFALSLHLIWQTNGYWAKSEQIYASLVQDFRWYDRDEVIILASPDCYHGVLLMRIIGQESSFGEALELRRKKPFTGRILEAVQYNVNAPADGVQVEADSSGRLYKISFPQYGNWWWRNGIGATDYENDRFTFRGKEWHVEVELKEKRPNTAIIYPVGGHWTEIK